MTHGKSCVNMHVAGFVYKMGGHNQFVEEEKEKKEKTERMRRKGERKMLLRKSAFRRSELIEPRSKVCIFDEVGILPTLVYFPP